jgi:hypothetical protein
MVVLLGIYSNYLSQNTIVTDVYLTVYNRQGMEATQIPYCPTTDE